MRRGAVLVVFKQKENSDVKNDRESDETGPGLHGQCAVEPNGGADFVGVRAGDNARATLTAARPRHNLAVARRRLASGAAGLPMASVSDFSAVVEPRPQEQDSLPCG